MEVLGSTVKQSRYPSLVGRLFVDKKPFVIEYLYPELASGIVLEENITNLSLPLISNQKLEGYNLLDDLKKLFFTNHF